MCCMIQNNLQSSNLLNSVIFSEWRNVWLCKFGCAEQLNSVTFVNTFCAVLWKKWKSTALKIRSSRWFNLQLTYCRLTVSMMMLYKWKAQKVNLKNVIRLNYEWSKEEIFWKNQYLKRERHLLKGRKPIN